MRSSRPSIIFALQGSAYALNWDFGGGNNYPYFFLNWDSPAGAFGFSSEMPYFMGCFYWIVVMIAFISLLSLGYIALIGKLNRRAQKKELKASSSDGR